VNAADFTSPAAAAAAAGRRPPPLLEAMVTTAAQADAACAAGADRLELCGAGDGGLTPDPALLAAVCARANVPVHVMCRPHADGFVYADDAARAVREAIGRAAAAGADGVVLGAVTASGAVDRVRLAEWIEAARPMRVVVHRVFDMLAPTAPAALATIALLESLGVDAVLTSGGAATAWAGRHVLAALAARAAARRASGAHAVEVIAGGGVRADHAVAIVAATGVRQLHARAEDATVIRAQRRALTPAAPVGGGRIDGGAV
jgi:copper homeostasis protein